MEDDYGVETIDDGKPKATGKAEADGPKQAQKERDIDEDNIY